MFRQRNLWSSLILGDLGPPEQIFPDRNRWVPPELACRLVWRPTESFFYFCQHPPPQHSSQKVKQNTVNVDV